jgi:hypothetical protein
MNKELAKEILLDLVDAVWKVERATILNMNYTYLTRIIKWKVDISNKLCDVLLEWTKPKIKKTKFYTVTIKVWNIK